MNQKKLSKFIPYIRRIIDIVIGRYCWVLEVYSLHNVGDESFAKVSRVLKSSIKAKIPTIDISFYGTLQECRLFMTRNGGICDGVILVDCATPVKLLQNIDYNDFPGYSRENFETISSLDGTITIQVLKCNVQNLSTEIEKYGFPIFSHIPAIIIESSLLENKNGLYLNDNKGIITLYVVQEGTLIAYYCISTIESEKQKKIEELSNYVESMFCIDQKHSFQNELFFELPFNPDNIAVVAAQDSWLFHSEKIPSFHKELSDASQKVLARNREATLFRRIFKLSAMFIAVSFTILLLFSLGGAFYSNNAKGQLLNIEKNLESKRELNRIIDGLKKNRSEIESFIQHRSHTAQALSNIAIELPSETWVTQWNIIENKHTIQGYSTNSDSLSAFLAKLEGNSAFINARLRTTENTTWKHQPVIKYELSVEALP